MSSQRRTPPAATSCSNLGPFHQLLVLQFPQRIDFHPEIVEDPFAIGARERCDGDVHDGDADTEHEGPSAIGEDEEAEGFEKQTRTEEQAGLVWMIDHPSGGGHLGVAADGVA